jgi:predicted small secreted protein
MSMKTTMLSFTLLVLLSTVPLLSACHTTAGVGEDISDAGRNIQHDANHDAPRN